MDAARQLVVHGELGHISDEEISQMLQEITAGILAKRIFQAHTMNVATEMFMIKSLDVALAWASCCCR